MKDLGKPKHRSLRQLEHLHSYIMVYYVVYIQNILEKFIVDKYYSCWKYALEAIINWLLLYFLVHDNCLLSMLELY